MLLGVAKVDVTFVVFLIPLALLGFVNIGLISLVRALARIVFRRDQS